MIRTIQVKNKMIGSVITYNVQQSGIQNKYEWSLFMAQKKYMQYKREMGGMKKIFMKSEDNEQ